LKILGLRIKLLKKIIFISITILFSLVAIGQQIKLNDGVCITLPGGTQKITKEQALYHITNDLNGDKWDLYNVSDENLYKIGNMLIFFSSFNTTFKFNESHLSDLKDQLDGLNKENKSYTSKIEKVNNNSIIIINYKKGRINIYRFYSINDNNTRSLNGTIKYNPNEQEEATTVLNNLLQVLTLRIRVAAGPLEKYPAHNSKVTQGLLRKDPAKTKNSNFDFDTHVHGTPR